MTTINTKDQIIYCDNCFMTSGPDPKAKENMEYFLCVTCQKIKDDCKNHEDSSLGDKNFPVLKTPHFESLAFSLMKQRFYFSLLPIFIGFVCWIFESFLPHFDCSHIIPVVKDVIFSAYRNYMYFLLMMVTVSTLLKLSWRIKTLLLRFFKNDKSLDLKSARGGDIETCSRINAKAQKLSKRIGWFLFHYSLIFCLYYLIGSCIPSLDLSIRSSSNWLSSVPSTSELIKSAMADLKASENIATHQNSKLLIPSLKDDEIKFAQIPISKKLGELNLPYAESLVLCQNKSVAFVSVSKPVGMIYIVSISDPEYPQVLGSINLKKRIHSPRNSLAVLPDNRTLVVSNMRSTEIVNVEDIYNPQVVGSVECKAFDQKYPYSENSTFRVSIAFSEDGKAIFIAGMGLLGYDISNRAAPKEILFDLGTFQEEEPLVSSIAIQDNILYVANGILNTYDISNLEKIIPLASFSTKTLANSLILQNEAKRAFVIGCTKKDFVLEEVDISNPKQLERINLFELNLNCSQVPTLLALTNDGENLFLASNLHDLYIFNFARKKFIDMQFENLVEPISSLQTSSDNNNVYVIANQLLAIYKLYNDYPNRRIFSQVTNLIGSSKTKYPGNFMSLFFNDQILVLATSKCRVKPFNNSESCGRNDAEIEIFNISNPAHPSIISAYPLPNRLRAFHAFPEENKIYVTLEDGIYILDLSNPSKPSLITSFPPRKGMIFKNSVFTPDGKIGFLYQDSEKILNLSKLSIYNFSDLQAPTLVGSIKLTREPHTSDLLLSNDGKIIFIIGTNIIRIDISDLHNPSHKDSYTIVFDGQGYGYAGFLVPNRITNQENLFIKVRDFYEDLNSLQFYNLTNFDSSYILPEFLLLKSNNTFDTAIVPSRLNSDLIYLTSHTEKGENILLINVSNPAKPALLGAVPVPEKSGDLVSMIISHDSSTAYISTQSSDLQIVQCEVPHTLYLESETFPLGRRVPTKAIMLSLNDKKEYSIIKRDKFKLLEVSLFDFNISSEYQSPQLSSFQLPSWMIFDRKNCQFTIHPRQGNDIGEYGLRSVYSTKVNISEFNQIDSIGNNDTLLQELIDCLIYHGYLDNKHFLTLNFDEFNNSKLKEKFENSKKDIEEILRKSYFETFTMFEIVSSLEIKIEEEISIITPSDSLIVFIKLQDLNASARFLDKQYALLKPGIHNNEMTLIGSPYRVNRALKELVVDLENIENCDGSITIDDHLNRVLTKQIPNISMHFKKNTAPHKNEANIKSFQERLDKQTINGGQYFSTISLNNLFFDEYSDRLTYTLVEVTGDKEIRLEWLTIEDGAIRGTPPEERSGDEIQLKLTAKNPFKSTDILFRLKIQKTKVYAAKEFYNVLNIISGIIGTLVTWLFFKIWTIKRTIYNIYYRSSYRHFRDFYLEVGQKITSNIVYPIFFVKAENEQSQLILRELGKRIAAKNDRQKAFTNFEISQHFVKQSGEINKEDIKNEIRKENISLGDVSPESEAIIIQLIFNELIQEQLQDEKSQATWREFQNIEKECENWVNWEKFPDCPIKEEKLEELEKMIKIKEISPSQASSNEITREENDLNKSLSNQSEKEEEKEEKMKILTKEEKLQKLETVSKIKEKSFSQPLSNEITREANDLNKPLINQSGKEEVKEEKIKIPREKEVNPELLKNAIGAHALKKQIMNELLMETDILVKGVKDDKNRFKMWMWFCKKVLWDIFDVNFTGISKNEIYGIQRDETNDRLFFTGKVDESFLNKTIVFQITSKQHKILKEIYIHGIRPKGTNNEEIHISPALEIVTLKDKPAVSKI